MKINLHCHTEYSDGNNSCLEMAKEHQKQGFSAFVVTDHVYPLNKNCSRAISSYEKFQRQTAELKQISNELKFPCIQGIELALWGEEILVFGQKATKEIFEYLENQDPDEQKKYGHTMAYKHKEVRNLLRIIKKNKENTAVILCHPHLGDTPQWVLKPLYPLLDGYEFQNYGHYYFTDETNKDFNRRNDRPVPLELRTKKKFYNSDAHSLRSVGFSQGNFHNSKIETIEDLICYVKEKQDMDMFVLKKDKER